MSEAVTPEQYAVEVSEFCIYWIADLRTKGLTGDQALGVTLMMADKLYPAAVAPVSPDVTALYERSC